MADKYKEKVVTENVNGKGIFTKDDFVFNYVYQPQDWNKNKLRFEVNAEQVGMFTDPPRVYLRSPKTGEVKIFCRTVEIEEGDKKGWQYILKGYTLATTTISFIAWLDKS